MRELVAAYGEDMVTTVSLDMLGYPPGWVDSGGEVTRLREALAGQKQR